VPPAQQPPASPGSSALSGFSHLSDLPEAHHLWDLNTPAGSPEAVWPQPVGHQATHAAQAPVQAPVQVQAAPEIIDLDQHASPEQERPPRHELRNNTWLDDRDIFDYTHVIIQRIAQELGTGGFDRITQRMNFADPQQVSHLLHGDATLRAQVLSHFNAPVVFLPVNRATENDLENHWSLLVVAPYAQSAFHFDSLDRPNSEQLGVASQVTRAMGLPDPLRMPMAQQQDGHSCGDHVLAGIEELTRRIMRDDISLDLRNLQPDRQAVIDGLAAYDHFAEEVRAGRAQPQPHPMQAAPRRRQG
jgi:type III effector protein XopD